MTTPDPTTARPAGGGGGAWSAVARLLSLQLLAVVAVTAVITGIYALAGPHQDDPVTAGSPVPGTTTSPPATSKPAASEPAGPAPSTTAPASPAASQPPPAAAKRLKVNVLNQSAGQGTAAKTADRVRALGWTVGRVADFRGNITETTVYYPRGESKAARELAASLPRKPRVLPRFSTLAGNRLTVIITR
jgi:hypothetical protein